MNFFWTWLWFHTKALLMWMTDETVGHHEFFDVEYKYAQWRSGPRYDFQNGDADERFRKWNQTVRDLNETLSIALRGRLQSDDALRSLIGTGNYYLRAVPCFTGVLLGIFPASRVNARPIDPMLAGQTTDIMHGGDWPIAWNDGPWFQFIYSDGKLVPPHKEGEYCYRYQGRPYLVVKLYNLLGTTEADPAPAYC